LQIESTPKHSFSPPEIEKLEGRLETLWDNYRGPQEYAEIASINFALKRFDLAVKAVDDAEALLAGESLQPIYLVVLIRAKHYAKHHFYEEAKADLNKILPLRGIKHELQIFELSQKVEEKLQVNNPPKIFIPQGCSEEKGVSLAGLQRRDDWEEEFSLLYEKAMTLINESKISRAKELLTKMIHEGFRLEFCLYSRAIVNYQLGLYEFALKDILEAEERKYPFQENALFIELTIRTALERSKAVLSAKKAYVEFKEHYHLREIPEFVYDDLRQAKALLDNVIEHNRESLYLRALVNHALRFYMQAYNDIDQVIHLFFQDPESYKISDALLQEASIYNSLRESIKKAIGLKT